MRNNVTENSQNRVESLIRLKEKFIVEIRSEEIPEARNTFTRLMRLYYQYYQRSIKEEFDGARIEDLVKNIGLDFNEVQKGIEEDFKKGSQNKEIDR